MHCGLSSYYYYYYYYYYSTEEGHRDYSTWKHHGMAHYNNSCDSGSYVVHVGIYHRVMIVPSQCAAWIP